MTQQFQDQGGIMAGASTALIGRVFIQAGRIRRCSIIGVTTPTCSARQLQQRSKQGNSQRDHKSWAA